MNTGRNRDVRAVVDNHFFALPDPRLQRHVPEELGQQPGGGGETQGDQPEDHRLAQGPAQPDRRQHDDAHDRHHSLQLRLHHTQEQVRGGGGGVPAVMRIRII